MAELNHFAVVMPLIGRKAKDDASKEDSQATAIAKFSAAIELLTQLRDVLKDGHGVTVAGAKNHSFDEKRRALRWQAATKNQIKLSASAEKAAPSAPAETPAETPAA